MNLPAAIPVDSSIGVPEWYAVSCEDCGTMFAVDPNRWDEGLQEMIAAGHGFRCSKET